MSHIPDDDKMEDRRHSRGHGSSMESDGTRSTERGNRHGSVGSQVRRGSRSVGKSVAERSSGLFSAEDWMCKSCGNINWARRSICNLCSLPRIQKVEARTGIGGGYNDREKVEYVKRGDSDDEFDEFGRRKRKESRRGAQRVIRLLRSPSPTIPVSIPIPASPIRPPEDDSDEDFDASKYALVSDASVDEDDNECPVRQRPTRRSRSNSRSPDEN